MINKEKFLKLVSKEKIDTTDSVKVRVAKRKNNNGFLLIIAFLISAFCVHFFGMKTAQVVILTYVIFLYFKS